MFELVEFNEKKKIINFYFLIKLGDLFNSTLKLVKEQHKRFIMWKECTPSIVLKGGVHGPKMSY